MHLTIKTQEDSSFANTSPTASNMTGGPVGNLDVILRVYASDSNRHMHGAAPEEIITCML